MRRCKKQETCPRSLPNISRRADAKPGTGRCPEDSPSIMQNRSLRPVRRSNCRFRYFPVARSPNRVRPCRPGIKVSTIRRPTTNSCSDWGRDRCRRHRSSMSDLRPTSFHLLDRSHTPNTPFSSPVGVCRSASSMRLSAQLRLLAPRYATAWRAWAQLANDGRPVGSIMTYMSRLRPGDP